jgi:hypothetical protein
MSKKLKLEKDYNNANLTIEHMAEEEIKKIREKISRIKASAKRTGEDIERRIAKNELEGANKKS